MKDLGWVTRVGVWTIGSAAFGIAEVLTAADPLGSEPALLLLSAIGLYALVGAIGGSVWHLIRRVLDRAALDRVALPRLLQVLLDDRLLALAPVAILLLPKVLIAWRAEAATSAAVIIASLSVCLLLLRLQPSGDETSAPRFLTLYSASAFAVWVVACRLKDLARIAEEKTADVALDPAGATFFAFTVGITALTLILSERLGRRSVAWIAGGLLLSISVFRLFQAPAYDLDVKPVDERLGRGTPVFVLVLDTTRADHMSVYGYPRPTTPELEELAEHAMVFDRATSTSSWTLPAHASLFTGLHPLAHGALRLPGLDEDAQSLSNQGIHRPAYPLPEDAETLAEQLSESGYATGAIVANYAYMDPAFQVHQGFDDYFAVRNTPVEPRILKVMHRRVRALPGVARYWQVYRDAGRINELAVRWLKSQPTHRFLLFLNYMEAHLPWGPHQPGLHYDRFAAEPELPQRPGNSPQPEDRFRERIDLYDSNIASMDAELGKFFDQLRDMELFDRSLIIVTADHGESFGENAFDGHGKSLNEAEIWIPLIIKYPGSKHVGRDSRRVQLVDIPPTVSAILGRPFRNAVDGRAITIGEPASDVEGAPGSDEQSSDNQDKASSFILAELYTDPREPPEVFHGYRAAIYQDRLKLVVRSDGQAQLFSEQDGLERPIETPAELQPWVDEQTAYILDRYEILEKAAKSRQSEVELDPEVAAGLEALGYI